MQKKVGEGCCNNVVIMFLIITDITAGKTHWWRKTAAYQLKSWRILQFVDWFIRSFVTVVYYFESKRTTLTFDRWSRFPDILYSIVCVCVCVAGAAGWVVGCWWQTVTDEHSWGASLILFHLAAVVRDWWRSRTYGAVGGGSAGIKACRSCWTMVHRPRHAVKG